MRLSPPSPCQSEPNCSSPTASIRAQLLVSHLHHVSLSPTAHVPLPLCQFKPNWRSLVSCLHVFSSPTARVPPPPCPLRPDRPCPAPTALIQSQSLVSHLHHVFSRPTARLPPPQHQFERNRSCLTSVMSSRSQLLMSSLHSSQFMYICLPMNPGVYP